MDNFIIGLLTKSYGLTEAEVKEKFYEGDKLKDDALDVAIALDTAKVKRLREDSTKSYTKGYDKAKAEVLDEYEDNLRTYLEVQSDKKGKDLFEDIKKTYSEKFKPGEITPDVVKKHPTYLELEQAVGKKFKPIEEYNKLKGEFDNYKSSNERRGKLSQLEEMAVKHLSSLELPFMMSDDPAKRKNQIRMLMNALNEHFDDVDFQNDTPVLLKGGSRLETPQGALIKFQELVEQTAGNYFDRAKQKPSGGSGGSGGGGNGGGTGTKWTGQIPANYQEFQSMVKDLKTPEEKSALTTAYTEAERKKRG